MARVKELFFYLSGEHDILPYAEVRAILEAERFTFKNTVVLPHVLCLESNVNAVLPIINRSCFTKVCGLVIIKCYPSDAAIIRAVDEADLSQYLKKGQTFSVKIKRTTGSSIDVSKVENMIGKMVLRKIPDVKVKLANPEVTFFGISLQNLFILGQKLGEPSREFLRKKSSVRPFTHPSSISPKIARGMVNLARVSRNSLVLDPFCGTGSFLTEAGFIGCRTLGSDIDPQMIWRTKQNLTFFNIPWSGLVISDAECLPFLNVDGIVTDPPYSRASSTHGRFTITLITGFLAQAWEVLPRGGYISIAVPDYLQIKEIIKDLGYTISENYFVREHKSLTREILVLRKSPGACF